LKIKGFTLIELLVVVAIISILSSVIMIGVQDVRNKSKVSKLKADFVQIRNAAELYKNDTDNYPNDVSDLIPKYLAQEPKDPFYLAVNLNEFSPIKKAYAQLGIIFNTNTNTYIIEAENNATFCGTTANISEIETGRYFIYSQNNIGLKNKNTFNKFKGGSYITCLGCTGTSYYLNNNEPTISPCLEF
jgi:prepilin-type N-terminal cleavage/methylation domain-containing protein